MVGSGRRSGTIQRRWEPGLMQRNTGAVFPQEMVITGAGCDTDAIADTFRQPQDCRKTGQWNALELRPCKRCMQLTGTHTTERNGFKSHNSTRIVSICV